MVCVCGRMHVLGSLFGARAAAGEGQGDGVLLGQRGQLLEELGEDHGAVDGVLDAQRLGLTLQAGGGRGGRGAAEERAVQRLAAVAHVRVSQLGGVARAGRAVGVAQDQVAQRRLTALHWMGEREREREK